MKKIALLASILMFYTCFQSGLSANANNLRSAMNETGETVSVWQNYDGANFNLSVASVTRNGVWSETVTLGANPLTKTNPTVAINNLGHIVVTWTMSDYLVGVNALYMSCFDGLVWSSPTQISTLDESLGDNFNVQISNSDFVVITWTSYSLLTCKNEVRAISGTLGSLSAPITL